MSCCLTRQEVIAAKLVGDGGICRAFKYGKVNEFCGVLLGKHIPTQQAEKVCPCGLFRDEVIEAGLVGEGGLCTSLRQDDDNLRCEQILADHPIRPQAIGGRAPAVQLREKLLAHRRSVNESFEELLQLPLSFKVPVAVKGHADGFPDLLELGEAEYGTTLDAWIECFGGYSTSERVVAGNDLLWQKALQVLCQLEVLMNESDPSSQISLRPGFTAMFGAMLVMKAEVRASIGEMQNAVNELAQKFHDSAFELFPAGSPSIPGVATSLEGASIHRIYYASSGGFRAQLVKGYSFLTRPGRVLFMCDIIKIALWIVSQVTPIGQFHIPPIVRMKTRNGHHITLKKDGLFKEFNHKHDHSAVIANIRKVYEAELPNVEQGVINFKTITIRSVGRKLKDAILFHNLSRETAVAGVTSAVEQMHRLGMAHCDICVENIFVDLQTSVVFLGDLEYCRPAGDAPPLGTRRGDPAALTAGDLDIIQLNKVRDEIAAL